MTFGVTPSPHTLPTLLIARKTCPAVVPADVVHASRAAFTHEGIGTLFSLLDRVEREREEFAPPESAANQKGKHGVISRLAKGIEPWCLEQPSALFDRQPVSDAHAQSPNALRRARW